MQSVFLLHHLHTHEDGEECWKTIGIYSTRQAALDAVERSKTREGFSDYPEMIDHSDPECKNGFNIDEYDLDQDHWEDGFVTLKA